MRQEIPARGRQGDIMSENSTFSSELPVIVFTRPADQPDLDWQEIDRGPGYFNIAPGLDVAIKIKSINDQVLGQLVEELKPVEALRYLDLAENRNITNEGLVKLKNLPQLTALNLSSCSITNRGIRHLTDLVNLSRLNLSYCNKLDDPALKTFESMRALTYVDLQGCLGFTKGGLARVRRRSLEIYR
jgi:hypothetical protein